MTDIAYERLDIYVDGIGLRIATARRGGELAPIVFLNGFGSTKEEYVDLAYHPGFREQPFLAYDAPGCGESSCEDLSKLSIPFLVDTADAVLQEAGIERFHLVGHSMGGLTAFCSPTRTPIGSTASWT
jgi:pimeloyl-ACP methyl ester carboxylesterase